MTRQDLLNGEWFTVKLDPSNAYRLNTKFNTIEKYTRVFNKVYESSKSDAGQLDTNKLFDNCFSIYNVSFGELIQIEVQFENCTVINPEIV